MHLVIFDIDGTLTQSSKLDAECFLEVMGRYVDIDTETIDWDIFEHVTDEGIARELLERDGRYANPDSTLADIREKFITRLRRLISGSRVQPIPGAVAFIEHLRGSQEHIVALATGAWEASARLKLSEAGIAFEGLPLATSSDSHRREEILEVARKRAVDRTGASVESTVYVGDGPWDVRAARRTDCGFVGLARGEQSDRLRRAGAELILPSFEDIQTCVEALERASTAGRTRTNHHFPQHPNNLMMMPEIQIHKVSPDALAGAWSLVEQYHESVADFAGEMAQPSKPAFLEYWSDTSARHVLVAKTSTEAVGFCLLQEIDGTSYEMGRCLELGAVFVREPFRRQGISKAFWREAVAIARPRGLPITSEVSIENQLSREIIHGVLADCSETELAERLRPKPDDPHRMQVVLWMPDE
ncbi:MAG: GNAT family N-acetyltransferase [Persicimonas sp.]